MHNSLLDAKQHKILLKTGHGSCWHSERCRASKSRLAVKCQAIGPIELLEEAGKVLTGKRPQSPFHTGSSEITTAGTAPLVDKPLVKEKHIILVRHGMTDWNESKRIQGDSDGARLTAQGEAQARRCRDAVSQIPFDRQACVPSTPVSGIPFRYRRPERMRVTASSLEKRLDRVQLCFASPIKRAWNFAEIVWADRQGPLIPLDNLKEAHLGWLQGMKQEEAAGQHEKVFRAWRETPHTFSIDGRSPVSEVFHEAKEAWKEMLLAEGSSHLVVTHKSILRALLCVALGLPEISFRAVDIHNGGICVFRVNKRGEPMLINLNLTAHMHVDGVHY